MSLKPVPKAVAGARPSRRARAALPSFGLYGEHAAPDAVLLHVESIAERSRKYNWSIDAHVHPGLHQIVWLRRGRVGTVFDGEAAAGEGPLAMVVPPGVAHAFRFERDSDGVVATLSAQRLAEGESAEFGEAMMRLFAGPGLLDYGDDPAERARLDALFTLLLVEQQSALAAESPVPAWLARAVVWLLAARSRREARSRSSRGAKLQSLYTRWVTLLEQHFREHWPVTRYAASLGLSVERLNRLVRAETGRNAQAACHARLMREACRRLVHVDEPISHLAFDLGFDDPAYFCRFFKRQCGDSPRAFRARHREQAVPP